MNAEKQPRIVPREEAVFRMDGNGVWRNAHGRIEHPRIIKYFNQSIQWDQGGFYLFQDTGEFSEKVYFPFEETALFVTDIRMSGPARVMLNSGRTMALDPSDLFVRNDQVYIRTRDYVIKFTQQALLKLSDHLRESDQGLVLDMDGTSHRIPEE